MKKLDKLHVTLILLLVAIIGLAATTDCSLTKRSNHQVVITGNSVYALRSSVDAQFKEGYRVTFMVSGKSAGSAYGSDFLIIMEK